VKNGKGEEGEMLSAEEREEIRAELPHYELASALAVEALKIVQRHRGWVDDEAVGEIADFLGLSADEVDSVATFYNLIFRKPVGRHVILLCDSVSCWIMGYEEILGALSASLGIGFGQTTADGRFTLLPVVCLGACDRAPALMIDDDLYGPVNPEILDQILAIYP
jgi:NADH-quinone oxidoreductase subunit E